ncbi:23S rRNA (pseudouridine(1915)-N(3))-methyltransferase RlmH [Anoxybacter fermentans]|uniref:Ribosomal RNA large subunit methyltransferase H n=1 Tax=Anoxybacter fermentans TaxID=1323375 RepID=A0A3Q9HRZ1_9FIRM|nr:23S rRNA (pseudouridine(1915)-N(3))-methyltransferase RlmH [Anoxybacter fermentans]AZR74216.1 23S rRNA (pseudouridine(1915)-N(3))-methyltransferase RlmH [Anoxybacter fermentans]
MKINIVAVGKIKENFIRTGIEEFLKRLSRYAKIKIMEVKDEKIPSNPSGVDLERVKEREADRILKLIPENSYVIVLAVQGKSMSSEELAKYIQNLMVQGHGEITFVIGGVVGLHQKVIDAADFVLSFSHMTFTHQMIRLILLEQLYRAFKIIKGEPYHY